MFKPHWEVQLLPSCLPWLLRRWVRSSFVVVRTVACGRVKQRVGLLQGCWLAGWRAGGSGRGTLAKEIALAAG